jgi:hypothetical protein
VRWTDALRWHGSLHYWDAFTPSAQFVVRQLREITLLPSYNRTYVATLKLDRPLPPDVFIKISRIAGVEQINSNVVVFGQDAMTFDGKAYWSESAKTLVLKTSQWIYPEHEVSFGFSIGKGFLPRRALNALISGNGAVTLLTQDMECIGNGFPALTGRLRQDCRTGYTAIDGWPCVACVPGTYKVSRSHYFAPFVILFTSQRVAKLRACGRM